MICDNKLTRNEDQKEVASCDMKVKLFLTILTHIFRVIMPIGGQEDE